MDARLGDLSGSADALRAAPAPPQPEPQPVRELRGAGRFKKCGGGRGGIEQERLRQ